MADSKNDITVDLNMSDEDRSKLKKDQFAENPSTRLAKPTQVQEITPVLVPELLEKLKIGQRSSMFSGIERCIRICDVNTDHAHHCFAMMVNDLSQNRKICTRCDRIRDPNANPRVINSSMIKLPQKDLEELGLTKDPNYQKPGNVTPAQPVPKAKRVKKDEATTGPRRTKVKTPNKVTIEMTMADLKNDPNVINVMLQKTLEAIFELPVSNFREAEEIRVVKERVESFLQGGTKE